MALAVLLALLLTALLARAQDLVYPESGGSCAESSQCLALENTVVDGNLLTGCFCDVGGAGAEGDPYVVVGGESFFVSGFPDQEVALLLSRGRVGVNVTFDADEAKYWSNATSTWYSADEANTTHALLLSARLVHDDGDDGARPQLFTTLDGGVLNETALEMSTHDVGGASLSFNASHTVNFTGSFDNSGAMKTIAFYAADNEDRMADPSAVSAHLDFDLANG